MEKLKTNVARWNRTTTVISLLGMGSALAIARILLVFFPIFILLDIFLFGGFGYMLGPRVYAHHWIWGIVLCIPSLVLSIFFFQKLGIDTAMNSGIGQIISLSVIPISACLGMYLSARKAEKENRRKKVKF